LLENLGINSLARDRGARGPELGEIIAGMV
jgi:hypothetical protein